jgi:uncharacterized protein (TIGR02569 family)
MTPPVRPSGQVVTAFGVPGQSARPLGGGQGRSWRAGDVVLKPVDDVVEAVWMADVLSTLVEDGFRMTRPVRSSAGEWVVEGWSAWTVLPGEHDTAGRWSDILRVGQKLNAALSGVPRPGFLDSRTHAWAAADRVAWGEESPTVVHEVLRPLADRLTAHLRPDHSSSQVIHGDLTGNVLFAPGLPPGVIDFTPYWRPARFCLAIVAVDGLLWHGAPARLLDAVPGTDEGTSLLARAALRRLITADRLAADRGSATRDDCLRSTVADHERVLDLLDRRAE